MQIIDTYHRDSENDNSNEFNGVIQRIESLTKLQRPYIKMALKKVASESLENAKLICDYITNNETEFNIKESTKEGKIKVLIWLSNFHAGKSFWDMTKKDILSYLNGLRKPLQEDPKQSWIGSYNIRQLIFYSFFKWLYNQDEPDHKKRSIPDCMKGIKRINKKDKIKYNPSDLWEPREHLLFLKYCPSKRDRCYHAMTIDTSARPHELLNLKIKDIIFKVTEENKQYAEIEIRGGKTGSRISPLIDSLPFVKDWIQNGHPSGDNIDSWLFVSLSKNAFGQKLTYDGLANHYQDYYKKIFFPNLLIKKYKHQRQQKDEDNEPIVVAQQETSLIKNMLTKPWNLYIFRHSALTEKSQILKEHILRNYAGWTMSSRMPQVYLHYYGNESVNSLLEAKGIVRKEDKEKNSNIVKPRICINCNEPNKPDSRFCLKCKMVLTFDSYRETLEKEKEKDEQIKEMQEQIQTIMNTLGELVTNQNDKSKLAKGLIDNGYYLSE